MTTLAHARPWLPYLLAAAFGLAALGAARADGGPGWPRDTPNAYLQECAACHTAYPPGMLPARSWQRLMAGLERHFGTDASLDAELARDIGRWLQARAGSDRRRREEPPQDRITRTAWFQREHRGIDPAVWTQASVKSAARCEACHGSAGRGRYDDDDALRLPAGLDARWRRDRHD